jgi:hypothetical protein
LGGLGGGGGYLIYYFLVSDNPLIKLVGIAFLADYVFNGIIYCGNYITIVFELLRID